MTTAIILAAGLGNRLRPHTNENPKCLVPLVGKALIKRQLSVLRSAGIDNITIVGGYKVDKLRALNLEVIVNERFATTNMVTTLFEARDRLSTGDDLIIGYGDIIYENGVLEKLLECDSDVCLVSDTGWRSYWERRVDDPLDDVETFKINEQGCVIELGKKPKDLNDIQGQFTGLFKFSAKRTAELIDVYDAINRNGRFDGKDFDNMYMTSFLQHLIDNNWQVKAVPIKHGWLEVDTVVDLALYHRLADDGQLDKLCELY